MEDLSSDRPLVQSVPSAWPNFEYFQSRYPFVEFIAVTSIERPPAGADWHWPIIPDGNGNSYLGFTDHSRHWAEALPALAVGEWSMSASRWLQAEGRLWQSAFFRSCPHGSDRDSEAEFILAIEGFDYMAGVMAGYFDPGPIVEAHDLRRESRADRWLECVLACMPSRVSGAYLVKRSLNIFASSLAAIDYHFGTPGIEPQSADLQQTPAGDATLSDTRHDTEEKLSGKSRPISEAGMGRLLACSRAFKKRQKDEKSITKKDVITEVAEANGWSASTLIRNSSVHPELFQDATVTRHKPK